MEKVRIEESLLKETDQAGADNRKKFAAKGVYVINLMSSPGAGKTSLLEQTIKRISKRFRIGVIEGDIQGSLDADRVAKFGVPVKQINTDGACHLDPRWVIAAANEVGLDALDILVIENVGNLVCPAEFDLGENDRVMLLSVPEGHDKPSKYPLMFRTANLLLINKIDLISFTNFDVKKASQAARALNQDLTILKISCRTEEGIDEWINWLENRIEKFQASGD